MTPSEEMADFKKVGPVTSRLYDLIREAGVRGRRGGSKGRSQQLQLEDQSGFDGFEETETGDQSGKPLLANFLGRIANARGVMPLEAALSAMVLFGDQETTLRLLHSAGMGIDKYQQNRHIARVASLRAPEATLTDKTLDNGNNKPLVVYRDVKSQKLCVTFLNATDDNGQRVKKTEQGQGSGFEHAIDGVIGVTQLEIPPWVFESQRLTNPRYEDHTVLRLRVQYPMPETEEKMIGSGIYPVKDFQRYPIAALKSEFLPLYLANNDRLNDKLIRMRSHQYIEFSAACEEGRHSEGIEMLVKRAGNAFKGHTFKLTKSSSARPPPFSSPLAAPSSSSSSSSSTSSAAAAVTAAALAETSSSSSAVSAAVHTVPTVTTETVPSATVLAATGSTATGLAATRSADAVAAEAASQGAAAAATVLAATGSAATGLAATGSAAAVAAEAASQGAAAATTRRGEKRSKNIPKPGGGSKTMPSSTPGAPFPLFVPRHTREFWQLIEGDNNLHLSYSKQKGFQEQYCDGISKLIYQFIYDGKSKSMVDMKAVAKLISDLIPNTLSCIPTNGDFETTIYLAKLSCIDARRHTSGIVESQALYDQQWGDDDVDQALLVDILATGNIVIEASSGTDAERDGYGEEDGEGEGEGKEGEGVEEGEREGEGVGDVEEEENQARRPSPADDASRESSWSFYKEDFLLLRQQQQQPLINDLCGDEADPEVPSLADAIAARAAASDDRDDDRFMHSKYIYSKRPF